MYLFRKVNKKLLLVLAVISAIAILIEGIDSFVNKEGIFSEQTQYTSYPEYNGKAYSVINNNIPYFTDDEKSCKTSYEFYGELDSLGRCSFAIACIGEDLMPVEERGSIGSVKPSGWQISKYDFINGKYLYNRCHLIGYQLSGENANNRNLITGTRYMNIEGMLPFENMVADYVKETGNHVIYRVTPYFYRDELIARGVYMEAYSVEDYGEGICYCVFVHNVQPKVKINYNDGTNIEIDG